MFLKRLLNPEPDIDLGDVERPLCRPAVAWDENGIEIEITPALQDQQWSTHVDELLRPDGILENDPNEVDNGIHQSSFFVEAQHSIEQWAIDNALSQTSSATPKPPVDAESRSVCYGMIYRASVKLRGSMSELDTRLSTYDDSLCQGHCDMTIKASEEQFMVTFDDGFVMGELNTQVQTCLENLMGQPLDFQVLSPIRAIRETISRATKEKEAVIRVNINVYGPREMGSQIGREFSLNKIYLQRPDTIRSGFYYDNPHYLKLGNVQRLTNEKSVEEEEEKKSETDKSESFKKIISDVYTSLKRGRGLVGLEGDERLRTSLLQHQKEALDFMCQRENGPVPEEFQLWKTDIAEGQPIYRHLITSIQSRLPRVETGGGILADEMGMGKTLSILALILRTSANGHEWATNDFDDANNLHNVNMSRRTLRRSRATLIVASSDLMINEWMQEMKTHFEYQTSNMLKTIKYHGQGRDKDLRHLRDTDIIITTYHTLASDYASGKNPLHEINWYRLVLDEAHIIRRQSTTLYRTVAKIEARSRWCLTGTPIQNRLEDIGSLFTFIRLNPFDRLSTFRQYIASPFEQGGKYRRKAIDQLCKLLDAVVLRRTKDLLHLPAQKDLVRLVEFSPEERIQYEQTKRIMFRAIQNQVGFFDRSSTLGLFQLQLQLRILCNHGTFQQQFSWNRSRLHLLDQREAEDITLGQEGEVRCSACRQVMPLFGAGTMYKRYTHYCRHVLCSECIEERMSGSQDGVAPCQDGFPLSCPLCAPMWNSTSSTAPRQPGETEVYFRPHGHSSKMEALLADVQSNISTTKSIVFSCWTHTLDLIGRYLNRAGIHFERIDGDSATKRRQQILDDFATNPALRILIMTTGTGAVGLNLVTANRVFIVEPQWNPSVENQAIARALRLGQAQDVQVTRYIVKKSVEQEMRTLQDKKLETAGIAWR